MTQEGDDRDDRLWGGCHCGKVRFWLVPPTHFAAHCHCHSCRKTHGAALVTWTSVPIDRFGFASGQAEVRWYASSPWISWGFCGHCGSSMLYRAVAEGHPEAPKLDRMYVTVAALDDPLDRAPSAHVSYEERVGWFAFVDGLPKHRGKTDQTLPE